MRKGIILFTVFILTNILHAQRGSGAIKVGSFSPGATEPGIMIGYEGAKYIDRNFEIGWSADWFHKSYIDQERVAEFNNYFGNFDYSLNEVRAKTNLHSIPVLFNMRAKFPLVPRVDAYLTGGIGAETLLIFYQDYMNPDDDEFDAAFGFNWRLGLGTAFQIGRRSDIIAEVVYHSASPSWSYEVEDRILGIKRTFEQEFDMSGMMARVGFRFYY